MNKKHKNELCRNMLFIRDVLETQVVDQVVSNNKLTKEEKLEFAKEVKAICAKNFDIVVDHILEAWSWRALNI